MDRKYLYTGILVISFFLIYNIILAFGSLEGAPKSRIDGPFFPYLSDKPLTEDGYYMLTVAWNIAEGKGFTYNNGINTTGVQPLATMVYAVPAFIVQSCGGDKYDFVRAVLILSSMLQVIFALLIYRLSLLIANSTDKGLYFLVSVSVVLLNFKVLLNFTNGLETGLYLILLSLFFLYWLKYNSVQKNIKHIILLGILSGLLLLCRLDFLVLLLTFYTLMILTRRIRFIQLAMILLIASLVYFPWQIYIFNVTGSILQSSARSQFGFLSYFDMLYQSEQYFSSVLHHLTPFLYTGNIRLWLMFPFGVLYLVFIFLMIRKYKVMIFSPASLSIIKSLLISIVISLIVFFLFSTAPYFYFRYLAFIMILSLPVSVIIFSFLILKVKQVFRIPLMLIPLLAFTIQAYLYFHSGKSALTITLRPAFILENFDDTKLIGAFQTGALGYYVDNVINLDGKMNNEALESYKTSSIENYIDKKGIEVLIEEDDAFIRILDSTYLEHNWKLYSMDIGDGRTRCYVRK